MLRRPLANAMSSLELVLYEHLLLCVIFVPIVIARRAEWRRMNTREWLAMLWIAWGSSAMGLLCFTEAIRLGNPTTAVLLQKAQPVFSVVLAALLLGEHVTARRWLYLAAAMASVYLVSFGGGPLLAPFSADAGRQSLAAALLALGAALLWGGGTVFGRYVTTDLSFVTVTALRIVCAVPLMLVLNIAAGHTRPPGLSGMQWLAMFWLSFVAGCAALLIYYRGLRDTPASLAAIGELGFPATATLLNWIFLGSRFTPVQVAGFAGLFTVILLLQHSSASGEPSAGRHRREAATQG